MLEIALCDDDGPELVRLKSIITVYCHEKGLASIIDTYQYASELLDSNQKYHLIFLDIKMQDLNGIELAAKIREGNKHVKIIFVTNYSNYQTEAFSVRAFGYVLKPFTEQVIYKQLDDYIEYSVENSCESSVTFNTVMGIKTINPSDIFYVEAWNHKIKIHCQKEELLINDTIMHVLSAIQAYGFSVPHKSFIVNMNHISHIIGYSVFLTNSIEIPISQKRSVEFRREFHAFLRNNFNLISKG